MENSKKCGTMDFITKTNYASILLIYSIHGTGTHYLYNEHHKIFINS